MREKINENPMAQMAVVGLLILAVGFLFMTRIVNQGGAEEAPIETGVTEVTVPASSPADPAASGAVGATATAGGVPLIQDAPLPPALVSSYESGKTVVVLLVKESGIVDRKLEDAVRGQLQGVARTSLFVDTADNVAKYTQITQAVNLDRVPALIVLRPKSLSSGASAASVSYGFRDPESIEQAVTDALFNGRIVGYSPD